MITVYSTTTCAACKVLKSKLANKGVIFNEINIDENAEAKAFLLANGFRSVPQVFDSELGHFSTLGDL